METQNNEPPSAGTENQIEINSASRVQSSSTHSTPTPTVTESSSNSSQPEETLDHSGVDENEEPEDRLTAIVRKANRETTTADEWLAAVVGQSRGSQERMPNGWWPRITTEFNLRHQQSVTITTVKNRYNRVKNRQPTAQTSAEQVNEGRERPLPATITDSELYIKVKNQLTIDIETAKSQQTGRRRTRKVYSKEVNHQVVEMLNLIIEREVFDQKANTLAELNDLVYACQLTYEEVTRKPKKESNWKVSIGKVIQKCTEQLEIVTSHSQEEAPSNRLKRICKANGYHSNNQDQLKRLEDQFEEKIAVFEKKLVIAENRTKFKLANKLFEFNRSMFYRNLDDEQNEIAENIDVDEVIAFWRDIWTDDEEERDYNELTDLMDPFELHVEDGEEKIKRAIEEKLGGFLPYWKTPGPDGVFNFFIKKLTAIHGRLTTLLVEAVRDPEQIDERLYVGTTYLIPKTKVANQGKELRPITCLPNIYKLLSKVVTALVTDLCEVNEVVSDNQLGTRRGCQGAKQQALLNKAINEKYDNALFTSWIDIQKAYDSVQHDYLMAILTKLGIPENILGFVRRTLAFQRTNLQCRRQEIGQVKIEKGLLQGDSLSPLLFVIAMEPLSRRLNQNCDQLCLGNIQRNHLIFIDDIKLMAETKEGLIQLCALTDETLRQMGLKVNQLKSASNIEDGEVFGEKVDDVQGYKYLGVLEDSRNVVKEENKVIVVDKAIERTKKLCQTKLNAVNLFRGINEFALSTLNYYIGLLPFKPKEYDEIDKKVRRVLSEYKVTRNAANMDRLYLKRDRLGRGLTCVVEKAELMMLKLFKYLEDNPKTRPLIEQEKKEATKLGQICEHLKEKYELEDGALTEKDIRKKQEESRMGRIKEKVLHGILFNNGDNAREDAQAEENGDDVSGVVPSIYDRKTSSMWLMKGNISPQHEGMLTKLQDRNLYFGGTSKRCPHCSRGSKSVEHLATHCGGMLDLYYKKRHDEVVRCLHFLYAKKYGLNRRSKLKNYKVEKVISNERVKIKSDVKIETELAIECNKPDLMIHDRRTKEITLIEVGITNKNILSKTELHKYQKYDLLKNELMIMYPGCKVKTIPVVMTWDGLVTRHFKGYMQQLDVHDRLLAYMQSIVLKRTCESILEDCRRLQRGDWLEEEVDEMMAQLESEPAESQ